MQKLIGTNYFNYNQTRNFIHLNHQCFRFVQVKDLFQVGTNVLFSLRRKTYAPFQFLFLTLENDKVQLYHFFNTITLFNKKSWIVTFETSLPRLGESPQFLYDYAARRLAHKSCFKIIAMSACAARIQQRYLHKNYPKLQDAITSKMMVLHPPQKPLISCVHHKKICGKVIVFTFVGADFFRKGGMEILEVFDFLINNGYSVQLNIISSLQYGDYASHSTSKDYKKAIEIIKKYPCQIHHSSSLGNDQVLELLKKSHIGLLPTYADTYGYSVLEAQAAACPVISTNVRALPEINNNDCGWVIELPKEENGNATLNTPEAREMVSGIIKEKLKEIILTILKDNSIIVEKGKAALERIRQYHDPETNAKMLADIYEQAIKNN